MLISVRTDCMRCQVNVLPVQCTRYIEMQDAGSPFGFPRCYGIGGLVLMEFLGHGVTGQKSF
jgi:hypothetical protein